MTAPAASLSHINNLALSCIRVGGETIWLTGWPALPSPVSQEAPPPVSRSTTASIVCVLIQVRLLSAPTVFYLCCHFLVRKIKHISAEWGSHSKCQKVLHTLVSLEKRKEKPLWLHGEALNFPKASQPPPITIGGIPPNVSALIFSHTRRQSKFGPRGLSIKLKNHLQAFGMRMRTLGIYNGRFPQSQWWKRRDGVADDTQTHRQSSERR